MALRNVLVLVGLALLAACGPGDVPLAAENTPLAEESTVPALRLAFAGSEGPLAIDTSSPALDFGQVRVGKRVDLALELRNLGSAPVKLESLALAADSAFTLASAPVFPITLQPQSLVVLKVGFAPTTQAAVAGKLTITSNDPSTPTLSVALRGQGVAPQLLVEPTGVDFGAVLAEMPRKQEVIIRNVGTAPAQLTSVALRGGAPFSLSAPSSPVVLAPNASLTVTVFFTPKAEGLFETTLSLRSDDASVPFIDVSVRGQGIKSNLVASVASVDFGTVPLGESQVQQLLLRNTGSATAHLVAAVFEGAPDFSLPGAAFPLSVPPGGLVQLAVKYHAARAGPSTGTLTLVTSESALTLGLTGQGGGGTGTDPALVWAPSAIDFGAQRKGTTATRLLTVTNEGTAPRIITAVALDANAYPVFTATTLPLLPFFLAPGSSVQFQVTFNPVGTGTFASALTLTTTDPLNPFTSVPLTGTGTGTSFGAD